MSFTGFYRVLLRFTGIYWVFIRLYWVFIGFRCFLWALLGFYWALLGFYWALLGFYWGLLGFTGFYWVLLGFTGFYWVLLVFTGFRLKGFTYSWSTYILLVSVIGWSWVFNRFYRVLSKFCPSFPHSSWTEFDSISPGSVNETMGFYRVSPEWNCLTLVLNGDLVDGFFCELEQTAFGAVRGRGANVPGQNAGRPAGRAHRGARPRRPAPLARPPPRQTAQRPPLHLPQRPPLRARWLSPPPPPPPPTPHPPPWISAHFDVDWPISRGVSWWRSFYYFFSGLQVSRCRPTTVRWPPWPARRTSGTICPACPSSRPHTPRFSLCTLHFNSFQIHNPITSQKRTASNVEGSQLCQTH